MKIKIALFFAFSFLTSCFLLSYLGQTLARRYNDTIKKQTTIISEVIHDRFELVLNTSYSIGLLSGEVFSSQEKFDEDYIRLGKKVIGRFNEILGFNLLNKEGVITKIFPPDVNAAALNMKSQNYHSLVKSYRKGDAYWLSPPFMLFQKVKGFSFYVPIVKAGELSGWIAPVISRDLFFKKLKLDEFLEEHQLIIKDKETGENYFRSFTGVNPPSESIKREHVIYGRTIIFYSWPKRISILYHWPRYLYFVVSLFLSVILTYSYYQLFQRNEIRKKLKKISALIKFVTHEASNSIMSIYRELNLMGKETGYVSSSKVLGYVSYISTVLDQIALTDKLITSTHPSDFKQTDVVVILHEQLELFKEKFSDKKISVTIENGQDFTALSNEWLLGHSVFGNVFRYILFYAKPGSELKISLIHEKTHNIISFFSELDGFTDNKLNEEMVKRCLEISHEVVKLGQGELEVIEKPIGTRTIALTFSK